MYHVTKTRIRAAHTNISRLTFRQNIKLISSRQLIRCLHSARRLLHLWWRARDKQKGSGYNKLLPALFTMSGQINNNPADKPQTPSLLVKGGAQSKQGLMPEHLSPL